jgi:hypothetical protein
LLVAPGPHASASVISIRLDSTPAAVFSMSSQQRPISQLAAQCVILGFARLEQGAGRRVVN